MALGGSRTLWNRVDEPVLRWVASLPSSLTVEPYRLEVRDPEPFEPIAGLDGREVDESLRRLRSHRLVDGQSADAIGNSTWSSLRVTAAGLVVLGEWPDLDRVASAASLNRILRSLAESAPKAERSALLRAAGGVARTGDEVLRSTVSELAHDAGKDLAGG